MKHKQTEILIIGTGLAGCIAALTAAKSGKEVTIITKTKHPNSGNTQHAQGGIVYKGINDSTQQLKNDIILTGAGHCWEPAVDQLCNLGPQLVEDILISKYNIPFEKNKNKLDLTFYKFYITVLKTYFQENF
jgi:L-aspartate oxidase